MTIHVIGLGVAQQAVLTANALNALKQAQIIIGSTRQLQTIANLVDHQAQQNTGCLLSVPFLPL